MGKLLDYLKAAGGAASLCSPLGTWRRKISEAVDQLLAGGGGGASTAASVSYDDSLLPHFNATNVQSALDVIKLQPITQAAWFVNSATGNDANDGATALTALATLAELDRRLRWRRVTVDLVITLAGNFPAETLRLWFFLDNTKKYSVTASTTVLDSSSVTAYTTFSAPATWAELSDVGIGDFSAYLLKRFKLTTSGAVGWVLERTAATTARVSQCVDVDQNSTDPAGGDAYDIEDLAVTVGGVDIQTPAVGGQPSTLCTVENLVLGAGRFNPVRVTADSTVQFFGCLMETIGNVNDCYAQFNSCFDAQGREFTNGRYFFIGGVSASCIVGTGARVTLSSNFATATSLALFSVENGGIVVLEIDDHPFLGSSVGSEALSVQPGGLYRSAGDVWGVDIATATGIGIYSNGSFIYNSKPTLAGTAQDTVIGGAPLAYAAIPAADATNGARMAAYA